MFENDGGCDMKGSNPAPDDSIIDLEIKETEIDSHPSPLRNGGEVPYEKLNSKDIPRRHSSRRALYKEPMQRISVCTRHSFHVIIHAL